MMLPATGWLLSAPEAGWETARRLDAESSDVRGRLRLEFRVQPDRLREVAEGPLESTLVGFVQPDLHMELAALAR
jgi:hypothetical protein